MDKKAIKVKFKVLVFYIIFAVVQFYFFWGLCHLMPGERYYQRMARIKANQAPSAPVVDPNKKSQIPNFETDWSHTQQIHDKLRRSERMPEDPLSK